MKKYILTTAFALTTIVLNAQNGAVIEYKMSSTKNVTGTMKINYSEFGSVSELKMVIPQMQGGEIITKYISQKNNPDIIYAINDKAKTYKEIKKQATETEDTKTYTVKKLGEETINGYKCTHAMVTEGPQTVEVWNTKDIKEYEKYVEALKTNKDMSTTKRDKALKDAGCEGFSIKTIKKGNEREGDVTMELVKFDKKAFTKIDFEIPAGYAKSESATTPASGGSEIKTQQEIMKMTPEERAKYIEEMKKKYGKQ